MSGSSRRRALREDEYAGAGRSALDPPACTKVTGSRRGSSWCGAVVAGWDGTPLRQVSATLWT
jgi:hypothetical protein